MKTLKSYSIYKNITAETIDLIRQMNEGENNTFLIPTRFISQESAQLAFLLDEYYNYNRQATKRKLYRSFFANSLYEAIQGAMKLIRHNGFVKRKEKRDTILIMDTHGKLQFFINPLNEKDGKDFLIPGVMLLSSIEALQKELDKQQSVLGVILINTEGALTAENCSDIVKECKGKGIISLLCDTDMTVQKNTILHDMESLPDMIVLGEALTHNEIPFAVFSMTVEVHKPWANVQNCLLHSSTYSGNKLSVTRARDILLEVDFLNSNKEIREEYEKIGSNINEVLKNYEKYINPALIRFYEILGYDFICKKAHGSWLTVQDKKGNEKQLLDAVSGGGAAPRGHTPHDIIPNVVLAYQEDINYWDKLKERFKGLLGFDAVFPAVSGATAVENAFILALLASSGKKKILVFKSNYAGKTIISLAGTPTTMLQNPFQPLYRHVVYIDPFSTGAYENVLNELKKGDIAMVWFETIQGGSMGEIPQRIMEIIQEYKEKSGYFIGIDEILMGFYRLGKLTSYSGTCITPDIVTFSKILTDGTFPVGATLTSEKVYCEAMSRNPEIVSFLETLYKNQFGALIAFHSIQKHTEQPFIEQNRTVNMLFEKGMKEIEQRYNKIMNIAGKAHIYQIHYKSSSFMKSLYFCNLAVHKHNLLIYLDRLSPAVSIPEPDAKELVKRLGKLFSGNSFILRLKVFLFKMKFIRKMLI